MKVPMFNSDCYSESTKKENIDIFEVFNTCLKLNTVVKNYGTLRKTDMNDFEILNFCLCGMIYDQKGGPRGSGLSNHY